MTAPAASGLRAFLSTQSASRWTAAGQLVSTKFIDPSHLEAETLGISADELVAEHDRIEFPNYPYEWPAEMLHCAAAATLELSLSLLDDGFWLKDASPYNILFRGPKPVFIDLLSFEPRPPLDQSWRPYAQFVRTFLLPLLAARLGRNPAELLLSRRDGPEPAEVYRWCSLFDRLRPGFFSLVTLPAWLDRGHRADSSGIYRSRPAGSAEQAAFVLRNLYGGLRRSLKRLEPRPLPSTWTGYLDHKSLYSAETLAVKEDFVREALAECHPSTVLDVGCNEGYFSALVAHAGASVVAIDSDPAVVGRVWSKAAAEKLNILPLIVDLTRPTPALGWRNEECPSFLDRAYGQFDMVMLLAVVHHMLVTERVPINRILELLASLTRRHVLIEFVGPSDPMFQRLVRGRDLLYNHLTVDHFEQECKCFFTTIRKQRIPGLDRYLLLLGKN